MSFQMYVPTRILFGQGQLDNLRNQQMPGKKALIVISDGKSSKTNGSLSKTQEQLKQAGVEWTVFDRIMANPLKSTVMDGAACARENNCDFIVALGGGSVMDASKAIAAMATNDGDLWDYIFGGTGKGKPLTNEPLPIIAITTTAGTGSEVDQYGVISNKETHEKIGFGGSDSLFPKIAIVDPELMKTVPPKFTALQGFDALFHSVECYISTAANLMSDMYALTAIENIGRYLARAVKDGSDREAREHVAFANTLSGVVMTISVCTSEHSLEHAMSAYHQDLPHGAGLIMISKAYFTHFIETRACDERFVRMAQVLGVEDAAEPLDFITALVKLQEECGVADLKMSDYGIRPDEFMTMAQNARATMGGLFTVDRVPLSDEDCAAIFEKSYR
ncbi:iron-containing alcohol dehydrogenase [Desulfosporosinus youngiae]|uniref:Alcohol dehydrogenase, class IV n=1 Tax=Desulfosporosinus youngiae DSM 17734 TaxID=768710 RepID=H5XW44_9FIRM|nr:iron-containing alcohol dehydrogenase [Desulfosporosinus youngiae]EHQ90637.1 alcohol dehydrogenase, class IV [Desulfosporosinus youngiae DSM 17734]